MAPKPLIDYCEFLLQIIFVLSVQFVLIITNETHLCKIFLAKKLLNNIHIKMIFDYTFKKYWLNNSIGLICPNSLVFAWIFFLLFQVIKNSTLNSLNQTLSNHSMLSANHLLLLILINCFQKLGYYQWIVVFQKLELLNTDFLNNLINFGFLYHQMNFHFSLKDNVRNNLPEIVVIKIFS